MRKVERQLGGQHQRPLRHALAAHVQAKPARARLGRGGDPCRRQVVERRIGGGEIVDGEIEIGARIADGTAHLQPGAEIAGQGRSAEVRQPAHRKILQRRIGGDLSAGHRGIGAQARTAKPQVEAGQAKLLVAERDLGRGGEAQRLLGHLAAQLQQPHPDRLRHGDLGARREVERLGRGPRGIEAHGELRSRAARLHLRPHQLRRLLLELLQRGARLDPRVAAERVVHAGVRLEPLQAPEIADQLAHGKLRLDVLPRAVGPQRGVEVDRTAQRHRQYRPQPGKVLHPAAQRAVDQRALEVHGQRAVDAGARRAQCQLRQPQRLALQAVGRREARVHAGRRDREVDLAGRRIGQATRIGEQGELLDDGVRDLQAARARRQLQLRRRHRAGERGVDLERAVDLLLEQRFQHREPRQAQGQGAIDALIRQAEPEGAAEARGGARDATGPRSAARCRAGPVPWSRSRPCCRAARPHPAAGLPAGRARP